MRKLGWFAFVILGMIPASVAFGSRMVCETWRDFLYYRGNGAFLEWVGQPYQVCRSENDTREPPGNELPDDQRGEGGVHGGRGDPVTNPCERCNDAQDSREAAARKAFDSCTSGTFTRAQALCAAGHRRGRPDSGPIPRNIVVGRERECEEQARGRTVCRWVNQWEPNPTFDRCFNDWVLGFTDQQIEDARNIEGYPISILPEVVQIDWNGETIETLLGVDQMYQHVCDRPYNDALDIAEAHYEDCIEAVREVAETSGDRAVNCE